jgi:thioredoxin reductase
MKYKIVGSEFGGQFMVSGEVLNYPGIVETTGIDFANTMKEQLKFNDVEPVLETVQTITKHDNVFSVTTDKNTYETKSIIVASGARARTLDVKGEDEFARKGVTYCSICDGPLFAGRKVAIIGGGNSALEAVDFMKDIASEIHLLVRGDKLKGFEYLIENVVDDPKVTIHYNATTTEISGDGFVTGVQYTQDNETKNLDVEGVIIEIGRIPNTDFLEGVVALDDSKHIIIDCQTRTSVPGIFAAGDCASGYEYQYVISAGQGSMALIKAAKYLAGLKK